MELPIFVNEILMRLENSGYKAYAVGGCVRDLIMGRTPADWDICTDATPKQVNDVFDKTAATGEKYGTVTVFYGDGKAEVTTFRSESDYTEHRHPSSVKLISDLNEDLSRRDFTVNAMAMSRLGEITDPFGGREDIERKVIRCVGIAEKRFEEDALRMFRALRFSAVLGFRVSRDTQNGIVKLVHTAKTLSPERIQSEIGKILFSKRPDVLNEVIGMGLLDGYISSKCHLDVFDEAALLPRDKTVLWTVFALELREKGAVQSAGDFLMRLRLDRKTVSCAEKAEMILTQFSLENRFEIKKCMCKFGEKAVLCAGFIVGDGVYKLVKSVTESGEPYLMKDLQIKGDDIIALGASSGEKVGEILQRLLKHVQKNPEDNDLKILKELAKQMI